MTFVRVKDQLMGSGKSSRMIEEINNSSEDKRYIVVLPLLEECHRYAGTISDGGEAQKPMLDDKGNVIYTGEGCNASGRRFHHPATAYKRGKVEHIEELVKQGKDVVTTHSALKLFTPETRDAIKDNSYTLVIDEELECVKPLDVKQDRRKMLLDSGAVTYNEGTGLLEWNHEFDDGVDHDKGDDIGGGLSWEQTIRRMCINGSLMLIADENGDRKMFMWEYPVSFIKAFDDVVVMTYMFKGSVFEQYLKWYDIPYTVELGLQLPSNPFDLIQVVDNEKMNRVGDREHAFSATHCRGFRRGHKVCDVLKKNMINFFNNGTYGKSSMDERLWTTLKNAEGVLKGKGYTKRFLACNTKATNDYRETSHIAYIYNPHISPDIVNHLSKRGVEYEPDQKRFMLTEALQFIYRSRVRSEEPITLYVPSSRVRWAIEDWMKGKMNRG